MPTPREHGRRWESPKYLRAPEVERLQAAFRMEREPQIWEYSERTVHFAVELPPYAVAAVTLEFVADEDQE
jgi:hypothetical protein